MRGLSLALPSKMSQRFASGGGAGTGDMPFASNSTPTTPAASSTGKKTKGSTYQASIFAVLLLLSLVILLLISSSFGHRGLTQKSNTEAAELHQDGWDSSGSSSTVRDFLQAAAGGKLQAWPQQWPLANNRRADTGMAPTSIYRMHRGSGSPFFDSKSKSRLPWAALSSFLDTRLLEFGDVPEIVILGTAPREELLQPSPKPLNKAYITDDQRDRYPRLFTVLAVQTELSTAAFTGAKVEEGAQPELHLLECFPERLELPGESRKPAASIGVRCTLPEGLWRRFAKEASEAGTTAEALPGLPAGHPDLRVCMLGELQQPLDQEKILSSSACGEQQWVTVNLLACFPGFPLLLPVPGLEEEAQTAAAGEGAASAGGASTSSSSSASAGRPYAGGQRTVARAGQGYACVYDMVAAAAARESSGNGRDRKLLRQLLVNETASSTSSSSTGQEAEDEAALLSTPRRLASKSSSGSSKSSSKSKSRSDSKDSSLPSRTPAKAAGTSSLPLPHSPPQADPKPQQLATTAGYPFLAPKLSQLSLSSQQVDEAIGDYLSGRGRIAICVQPLWGGIYTETIAFFLEHYFRLGVDKVFLYIHSPDNKLDALTRQLEGRYSREHFELLPHCLWENFDGNTNGCKPGMPTLTKEDIHTRGQELTHQDCVYRGMGRFRWMLFQDLDEYLLPQSTFLLNPTLQAELAEGSRGILSSLFHSPLRWAAESAVRMYEPFQWGPEGSRLPLSAASGADAAAGVAGGASGGKVVMTGSSVTAGEAAPREEEEEEGERKEEEGKSSSKEEEAGEEEEEEEEGGSTAGGGGGQQAARSPPLAIRPVPPPPAVFHPAEYVWHLGWRVSFFSAGCAPKKSYPVEQSLNPEFREVIRRASEGQLKEVPYPAWTPLRDGVTYPWMIRSKYAVDPINLGVVRIHYAPINFCMRQHEYGRRAAGPVFSHAGGICEAGGGGHVAIFKPTELLCAHVRSPIKEGLGEVKGLSSTSSCPKRSMSDKRLVDWSFSNYYFSLPPYDPQQVLPDLRQAQAVEEQGAQPVQ